MKRVFNIILATLAIFGVACNPNKGDNGSNDNGPLTLSIDISEVTTTGVTISVTPSNNDYYFFDIVDKSYYDSFATPMEFLADFVSQLDAVINELVDLGAISSIEDILLSGSTTQKVEGILDPGCNYYVVAFGLSTDCIPTTTVTTKLFRTLSNGNNENNTVGINNGDKNISDFTRALYSNFDDYYGVGAATWTISLYNEDGRSCLNIDLMTDLATTELPWGEYPISSSFGVGTVLAGNYNNDYASHGTVWTLYDNDWTTLLEAVYCKSGTVTIVKEGDNYTVNVDAIDEFGNTAKFSYSGALEEPQISATRKSNNNLSSTRKGILLHNRSKR